MPQVEAKKLAKPLTILNAGKGSERAADDVKGFGRFRAQAQNAPQRSEAAVKAAVEELQRWLPQERSPLRGMLTILGSHGAQYPAHVNEKVAVRHKPASAADAAAGPPLWRKCGRAGRGAGE